MDREHGRARHAVLKPGPGRAAEGLGTVRQTLVEGADPPAVGENLRPGQLEGRSRHRGPAGAIDLHVRKHAEPGTVGHGARSLPVIRLSSRPA